jgi:quinol monooxygenase YgiN
VRSLGRWSRFAAASSGVGLLAFGAIAMILAHDGVGRLAILGIGVYLLLIGLTGRAERASIGVVRTIAMLGREPGAPLPAGPDRTRVRRSLAGHSRRGRYHGARMFALVVRFDLRPGTESEFDRLVEMTTARIRAEEPGTLLYLCHTVQGAPGARVFYELYRDHDAFLAHEVAAHVKEFHAKRVPYMAGPERVEFLGRLDGAGKGWPAE